MANDVMDARGKWLASFASDNTRDLYEKVFDTFIDWACANKHYSPPASVDPYDWLRTHRAAELKTRDPLHCERVASAWFGSLEKSGSDPLSRETHIAVLSSVFARLLPKDAGYLRLPFEPDELLKSLKPRKWSGDSWLASLAPSTVVTYRAVFDYFWGWASPHYNFPADEDPIDALRAHRRSELADFNTKRHCEGVVREWVDDLEHTDMDASSILTYRKVIHAFFSRLLSSRRGRLRTR